MFSLLSPERADLSASPSRINHPNQSGAMLNITPATSSDTEEIIALRHAAEDWLVMRGITQWTPRQIPESVFHRQVGAGEFFVARHRDRPTIIGACRLTWRDPDIWADRDRFAGYLHSLVVARDHAGAGLGRSLLAWAALTARRAGADLLRLDCVETNLASARSAAGTSERICPVSHSSNAHWSTPTRNPPGAASPHQTGPHTWMSANRWRVAELRRFRQQPAPGLSRHEVAHGLRARLR